MRIQDMLFEILLYLWWIPAPFIVTRILRSVLRRFYYLRNR